jgi:hypothetical protein
MRYRFEHIHTKETLTVRAETVYAAWTELRDMRTDWRNFLRVGVRSSQDGA